MVRLQIKTQRTILSLLMSMLLIVTCFIPTLGVGKESVKKKYPPYPDIWGYDLSKYQKAKDKKIKIFSADLMDDGDFWFEFRSDTDIKIDVDSIQSEWLLLKFFKQKIMEIQNYVAFAYE